MSIEQRVIQQLDWSTRHLKKLQKQCPARFKDHMHAVEMYGVMKSSLDLLQIDINVWLELVGLPYKCRQESYDKLFIAKQRNETLGKPMQRQMYYEELIYKLLSKNVEDKWAGQSLKKK